MWLGEDRPRVEQEEFVPQYDGDKLVNGSDYPVKHAAICTGTHDEDDQLLLHASAADGTNALWPPLVLEGQEARWAGRAAC